MSDGFRKSKSGGQDNKSNRATRKQQRRNFHFIHPGSRVVDRVDNDPSQRTVASPDERSGVYKVAPHCVVRGASISAIEYCVSQPAYPSGRLEKHIQTRLENIPYPAGMFSYRVDFSFDDTSWVYTGCRRAELGSAGDADIVSSGQPCLCGLSVAGVCISYFQIQSSPARASRKRHPYLRWAMGIGGHPLVEHAGQRHTLQPASHATQQ